MKGQLLFYTFLPGVTAAVLTTQSAFAVTAKGRVELAVFNEVTNNTSTVNLASIGAAHQPYTSIGSMVLIPKNDFKTIIGTGTIGQAGVEVAQATTSNLVLPVNQSSNLSFLEQLSNNFAIEKDKTSSQTSSKLIATLKRVRTVVVPQSTSQQSSSGKPEAQQKPITQLPTLSQVNSGVQSTKASQLLVNANSEKKGNNEQFSRNLEWVAQTGAPQRTPSPANPAPPPAQTPRFAAPAEIPSYLNSNPNPLQFPTRPEEVQLAGVQPLTLNQVLEIARRNNKQLQLSQIQLEGSRANLRAAQASLLPTFDVSGALSRSQSAQGQQSSEARDRQFPGSGRGFDEPGTGFNAQAELNYTLFTSGNRLAAIREAEEQVRRQELEVENQSEEVRLNVTLVYYDLQQADENVRITQSAVANAEASLKDAQLLETAGVGTRFDVLRSQVNLANAQQQSTNALSQQQIARRQLASTLSIPQTINIAAADEVKVAGLWPLTLEESIIQAYQNRPELQQRLADRNISEQQRLQALSATGPQVSLAASYSVLDQFNDNISLSDGYSLGVQARWRLYDGGQARARAASAKANIALAETQFAQQRDQIRFTVERFFIEILSNLKNVETSKAALSQATEALRLARLRFQAGVGTQTDVIAAENDLTREEGNRVRAIIEYNRALANLQRAVTTRTAPR